MHGGDFSNTGTVSKAVLGNIWGTQWSTHELPPTVDIPPWVSVCVCVFVCVCMHACVCVNALIMHWRLQGGRGARTFIVHYRLRWCVRVCFDYNVIILSMRWLKPEKACVCACAWEAWGACHWLCCKWAVAFSWPVNDGCFPLFCENKKQKSSVFALLLLSFVFFAYWCILDSSWVQVNVCVWEREMCICTCGVCESDRCACGMSIFACVWGRCMHVRER